jgi:hypothetical protein
MTSLRIGPSELLELRQRLVARDLSIVNRVAELRLMSARQIEALHFPAADHASKAAAARTSRRVLERLTRDRWLRRLERRVGGIYAGSAGFVYALGPVGQRLLELERPRPRIHEPSKLFVEHTLAISQLVVDATLADRRGELELLEVQTEPECWRRVPGLERRVLRPDLFVAIGAGGFELRWFVEIDRATMEVPRLLKKCHLYDAYYRSGVEQEAHEVFPRVLWITTETRGEALLRSISKSTRLTQRLFVVSKPGRAVEVLRGAS